MATPVRAVLTDLLKSGCIPARGGGSPKRPLILNTPSDDLGTGLAEVLAGPDLLLVGHDLASVRAT